MSTHWASKFDVFSIGLAVAKLVSTRSVVYSDTILPDFVLDWIQHTVDFNADTRWSAARAAREWVDMLNKTFSKKSVDPGSIPLRSVDVTHYSEPAAKRPYEDYFAPLNLDNLEFNDFFTNRPSKKIAAHESVSDDEYDPEDNMLKSASKDSDSDPSKFEYDLSTYWHPESDYSPIEWGFWGLDQ